MVRNVTFWQRKFLTHRKAKEPPSFLRDFRSEHAGLGKKLQFKMSNGLLGTSACFCHQATSSHVFELWFRRGVISL